jgi:hypothetical protein
MHFGVICISEKLGSTGGESRAAALIIGASLNGLPP